jgi:hypothetical protein
MPERQARLDLIDRLQEARDGTTVIAYVTSTRPGLEAQMGMDVIPIIGRHLRELEDREARIDLLLHSYGGESTVPWRLVTLIREYAAEFNVLVPHQAFSAATLTAMGADRVLMHPMGNLGPIDPTANHPLNPPNPQIPGQFLGVSVEDVASYISLVTDDVCIRHEDELIQAFAIIARKIHPLALGNVKRATSQSRMMAQKLLRQRPESLGEHDVEELIDKLASQLYFHGHPISRREARDDLRMEFVEDAPDDVASLMWELYEAYAENMDFAIPFDPAADAHRNKPLAIPKPGEIPQVAQVDLGPFPVVYVESKPRGDVNALAFQATINREWTGATNVNLLRTKVGWEDAT